MPGMAILVGLVSRSPVLVSGFPDPVADSYSRARERDVAPLAFERRRGARFEAPDGERPG